MHHVADDGKFELEVDAIVLFSNTVHGTFELMLGNLRKVAPESANFTDG